VPLEFSYFPISPTQYHRHAPDAIWKMEGMRDGSWETGAWPDHATTFCCHFEYIFHFYDEEMSIVHWTGHSFIHSFAHSVSHSFWPERWVCSHLGDRD